MTNKLLFRGDFNWYGQLFDVHRYAYTSDDAFSLMIGSMARRLDLPFSAVWNYFTDGRDTYHVQRIIPKPKKGGVKQKQVQLIFSFPEGR